MELCKMAQEYRRNTALLELRKKQLLAAKRHAKQYEVKYRWFWSLKRTLI